MQSGFSALFLRRALLGLWLLAPAIASAQANIPSFNLERLELNPSAVGSLTLDTARLLPEGGFRFQAVGHYQRDPLLVLVNGQLASSAIHNRVTVHATGALAVRNWLEVGLQVPVVAFQDSENLNVVNFERPASAGLGTPIVTGRLGVLSSGGRGLARPGEEDPLDLAVQVGLALPFGSEAAISREPGLGVQPKLLLGKQWGDFLFSGEFSGLLRPKQVLAGDEIGNQLNFGASVARVGHALGGELTFRSAVPLTQASSSFEVLAGVRYRFTPFIEGFALGGMGFGRLPGTPMFRGLIGIAYGSGDEARKPATGGKAPEETPVPPAPDKCQPGQPHQPSDCPDLDDDGDGVANGTDVCPTEKGTAERQGCPDPDGDGDGTPDRIDRCPTEPGPEDTFGCPAKDGDGDGVPDPKDACPEEPGTLDARGCPEKDTDKDTVKDHKDNCPKQPGPPTNNGCPEEEKQQVTITRDKLVIGEKIYFEFGKARLLERSFKLLNQVAKIIQEHPEIRAVSIDGHTDNIGTAEYNRRLSLDRAQSVRTYLLGQGVSAERVRAQGFGPDRPAATNDTEEGREKNRRVEFRILDTLPQEGSAVP